MMNCLLLAYGAPVFVVAAKTHIQKLQITKLALGKRRYTKIRDLYRLAGIDYIVDFENRRGVL